MKKIISIIGPSSFGKTIFVASLGKRLSKNKKTIILDFDLMNKDINLIVNKNENLDIVLGQDIIFKNKTIEFSKIENIIIEYQKEYDVIIINTSSECFYNINEKLIKLSDKSLFISGTNLIEIKKSRTLLKIYNFEWGIEKEKINIILNKYNMCSIDEENEENLLNEFSKYDVIGKIKISEDNNIIINDNILEKINT